ncbi:Calcineurin metallo-phosphoesterase superfamily protein [Trifolium repens]|nr:Calcineurin metallo-phosphoesterase superfamily protein [Trifolium repens]
MLSTCFHARTVFSTSYSCRRWKRNLCCSSMAASSSSVRIVVVGDVHDYWNFEQDSKALQFLQPDLVLFTGDFGEENLEVVQSVANIEFAKAVILGNHDCWYTKRFSDSEKDKVQLQLECLGKEHVAYQRHFLVVVNRYFEKSCCLQDMESKTWMGVPRESRKLLLVHQRIIFLYLLAHNGPTGLGSDLNDICGKDWELDGSGDHGDPDLACAISLLKENNQVSIPLVVFGHMHKELAHGNGFRKMIVVGTDNTIYLNGAIVPRVKSLGDDNKRSLDDESPLSSLEAKGTARAFTLVELSNGRVTRVAESWVSVVEDRTTLKEEQILFEGN